MCNALKVLLLIALDVPMILLWILTPYSVWTKLVLSVVYLLPVLLLVLCFSRFKTCFRNRKNFH